MQAQALDRAVGRGGRFDPASVGKIKTREPLAVPIEDVRKVVVQRWELLRQENETDGHHDLSGPPVHRFEFHGSPAERQVPLPTGEVLSPRILALKGRQDQLTAAREEAEGQLEQRFHTNTERSSLLYCPGVDWDAETSRRKIEVAQLRRSSAAPACHRVSIEFDANRCSLAYLYSYPYHIYSSADCHANRKPSAGSHVYD